MKKLDMQKLERLYMLISNNFLHSSRVFWKISVKGWQSNYYYSGILALLKSGNPHFVISDNFNFFLKQSYWEKVNEKLF